jgi:uncharacterized protein YcfJ
MPLGHLTRTLSSLFVVAALAVLAPPALAQGTTKEAPQTASAEVKPAPPAPSAADCAARADRAAKDSTSIAGGAVRGTVGGAAFGAIVGDSKGAKRGAAVGAVVGGAHAASKREDVYKRVYDDCMRGR